MPSSSSTMRTEWAMCGFPALGFRGENSVRRFGERQLDDKARANGLVVLGANQPIMFSDDAAGDGQAQAGAALLCRKVRQKKLVLVLRGDPLTAVGDCDLDRVVASMESRGEF